MGSRPHTVRATIGVLLLALTASACGDRPTTTFIHPQADFGLINRVAVLPMENLTGEPTAGEKVRQLLIIELLSSGAVEVVDVGEVARGIRAAKIGDPTSPGTEEVRNLAAELDVQGLVAGSVQEFAEIRGSGARSTSVSMVFRLIETDAGQVIWSSSVSQSGAGAMVRLFGVGGDSPTERARRLIRKSLKTLID
jgi:hypothetical protein